LSSRAKGLVASLFVLGALIVAGMALVWPDPEPKGAPVAADAPGEPAEAAIDPPPIEPVPGEAAPEPRPASSHSGWPTSASLPEDRAAPTYQRVVLVTLDTLRRDHVSCYGYARRTTPFLDSLAARGVLFENAVSSVSHTAPAHATILTGLHPLEHGVQQNGRKLDEGALDLGRLFGQAGFRTAAFVNVKFLEGICGSFETVEHRQRRGAAVVDAALAWLRGGRRPPRRFFLWVHLYDPHYWKLEDLPLRKTLEEVRASDAGDDAQLFDYLAGLHGLQAAEEPGLYVLGPSGDDGEGQLELVDRERILALNDRYDALVRYADDELARLYREIEGAQLGGRTLWIVTADHGEGMGSHGFSGHGGRIYEEQVAVPLVVHAGDDSLAPRRVGAVVQHVDLFPTLAEVLDADLLGFDAAIGGASLWPLLQGSDGWQARPAFSQRRPPEKGRREEDLYALRTPTHKYLFHSEGEDELYDLQADPLERVNRVGQGLPEEEALRRLLEGRLSVYRERRRGAQEVEIPDEWLEELRALGYAE